MLLLFDCHRCVRELPEFRLPDDVESVGERATSAKLNEHTRGNRMMALVGTTTTTRGSSVLCSPLRFVSIQQTLKSVAMGKLSKTVLQ